MSARLEYTVGPIGPMAMPGDLPATSALYLRRDYSVDEAVAANATSIISSARG